MPRVTHRSERFHWNAKDKKFSAEASDLGCTAAEAARGNLHHGQVYRDAADIGFAILSDKTGKIAIYTLKSTDENDGEVRAWEYEPAKWHPEMFWQRGEVAPFDSYKDTSVVIFND